MIQAADAVVAMAGRHRITGKNGNTYWRTDFLGRSSDGQVHDTPQAYLIDMTPGEVLLPHFHAVDQFQVFVAGRGDMGRTHKGAAPVLVHYADHHTGYGPITASAQGFSYFTLRAQSDAGAVFLHMDGYREKLQPSRRRHFSVSVALSTQPVLENMRDVHSESLCPPDVVSDDGLAATMVRMGPGAEPRLPEASLPSGGYLLLLAGRMDHAAASYAPCSLLFIEPGTAPPQVAAGPGGAELLLLRFPGRDKTAS